MGVINIPKLLEIYRELNSVYKNEHNVYIIQEGMTKKEIKNIIAKSDYISYIITCIEKEYIDKDKRTITVNELVDFIKIINIDVSYNVSIYATIYVLYLKAIQLMEKK